MEIGAGITIGGGITLEVPSGGGGGGYAPQYTSDPGGDPWPTTADYSYVTYHDSFGLVIKGMKSSSALYTFLSTAGTGDSFKVTFSGTVYTFTLGDFNPGTIYDETNGVTTFKTVSIYSTPSPTLSAGEGVTLYGTLITDLTEAGSGGGGAGDVFTVGDGKTVLINTSTGAAERMDILVIGTHSILDAWSTATLTRSGGSGEVTFDSLNDYIDNGDGTYTYSFYVSPTNYPGDYSWDSVTFTAAGGGGGSSTYLAGTDYDDVAYPPPISFNNSPDGYMGSLQPAAWINSAGVTALLALSSGSTYSMSALPLGDGAPANITVTLGSNWYSTGSGYEVYVSFSEPISNSGSYVVPFSVTV